MLALAACQLICKFSQVSANVICCMYPPCGSQYAGVNSELGQHCGEAEQEKVKQSDQAPMLLKESWQADSPPAQNAQQKSVKNLLVIWA